jgi:serine protease Do
VLTCSHILAGADHIDVRLSDGRTFCGTVVGTDPASDVAVLHIDGTGLPFLKLANSDAVEIGEWVLAVGSPFGLAGTVTAGIVSAKGRKHVGLVDHEDFIQTDAAVNPGNSGGPLLNLDGEVVGLNSVILSRSGVCNGVGLAVPANLVRAVHEQLVTRGRARRSSLGLVAQDLTADLAQSFGAGDRRGALVAQVGPDTPAAAAGIQAGDVIVAVGDRPVADLGDLHNRVALLEPGTTVDLTVLRDGAEKRLPATLGEQLDASAPASPAPRPPPPPASAGAYGLEVAPLTRDLAARLGYEDRRGVLVRRVEPGSAAERAGLAPGHLILKVGRADVSSVADFHAALSKADGKSLLFYVRDGTHVRYVVLSKDA